MSNRRTRAWATEQAQDLTLIVEKQPRARVVKGWAFMKLTDTEKGAVRRYLDTGLKSDLPEGWHRSFDFMLQSVLDETFA